MKKSKNYNGISQLNLQKFKNIVYNQIKNKAPKSQMTVTVVGSFRLGERVVKNSWQQKRIH